MDLIVEQFMARSDNFAVLVHDPASGETAAVDAPDAAPIRKVLDEKGWRLTSILVTHHHGDHVEGIAELKEAYGCVVTGPQSEAAKIPGLDRTVVEGDEVRIGAHVGRVIETPGHTLGHISFHFAEDGLLFCADTLFALGCGRVFEGTMPMMWDSLAKLKALPDDTVVYCGHEYTQANADFAVTIEPDNAELGARADEIARLRAAGRPTLPTTIGAEKRTNPFLRPDNAAIRRHLGMETASDADVFGEIRRRKDSF